MRKPVIERPFYLEKLKSYTGSDIIRVIKGVRRCGKSSLLLIYKTWLEEQYGTGSVMYLNFDCPDFFLDKSLKTMSEAIKASLSKTTRFLLLDEAKREDCSKIQRRGKPTNSALLESHYQSEHLQDIGMSRPICCYTSK